MSNSENLLSVRLITDQMSERSSQVKSLLTLCDSPEAPIQKKSGYITRTDYGLTRLLTGVTARNAYAAKKKKKYAKLFSVLIYFQFTASLSSPGVVSKLSNFLGEEFITVDFLLLRGELLNSNSF